MNKDDLFYNAALDIAQRKMMTQEVPGVLTVPRIGTGGNFINLFLWDTAFSMHWAKYHTDRFPAYETMDNFYRVQTPDGCISRETMPNGISRWQLEHPIAFAPPLLPWAELGLYEINQNLKRLKEVYPALKKQHIFNSKTYRRHDSLFFSDMLGSGMDDMPRWDDISQVTPKGGILFTDKITQEPEPLASKTLNWLHSEYGDRLSWNRQLGWCDTSCQMAFSALTLSRIASILDLKEDSVSFQSQHDAIADAVNELCYDEKSRFYYDRLDSGLLHRAHAGAFWALIAEVAPEDRALYLMDALEDPKRFNCPCGVPGISVSDPEFLCSKAYWRGPVWSPINYMVLCGLRAYGNMDLATRIASKLYKAVYQVWQQTGTIWETYDPMVPRGRNQKDFCGWSALLATTVPREFLAD